MFHCKEREGWESQLKRLSWSAVLDTYSNQHDYRRACMRGPVLVDRAPISRALRIRFFSSPERYTVSGLAFVFILFAKKVRRGMGHKFLRTPIPTEIIYAVAVLTSKVWLYWSSSPSFLTFRVWLTIF